MKKWTTNLGAFGSSFVVGLCPICIPAIGAFLTAIGLGFLVNETVLKPLLIILLFVALSGLFFSYKKEHKNIYPFIIGSVMAIAMFVGRYVYMHIILNAVLMYGGIAGLIAVTIWNLILRKKTSCTSCKVEEVKE